MKLPVQKSTIASVLVVGFSIALVYATYDKYYNCCDKEGDSKRNK